MIYQLLSTPDSHGDRQLNPRFANTLSAPYIEVSTAVARTVEVENWKSHKASVLDAEPLFATRVRDVLIHDDGRGLHDLLELRSHGHADARHNNADFTMHRSSVYEKTGHEKAERAQYICNLDQRLEHSPQWILSTLLV